MSGFEPVGREDREPLESESMGFEICIEKRPELREIVNRLQQDLGGTLFSLALYARTMWGLAQTACDIGSDEYKYCAMEARCAASDAGEYYAGVSVPALLSDVPYLRNTFLIAANAEIALREELQEAERNSVNRWQTNALIKANAWSDLGLPTPEELTATLVAGGRTTINGHFVVYDESNGLTWCTNPYGVDVVLFKRPTVKAVRSFLADMARNVSYGPTPE
jgi:hypothetical protein